MKDEYVLFLDESEFKTLKNFVIAGFAIKKDNISLLEQGLEEIKRIIWDDEYIKANNPILHCTDLQNVFSNRKTKTPSKLKKEYCDLIKKSKKEIEQIYNQVYGRMAQLLKQTNATVFSCIIKLQPLQNLFYIDETHNGIHLIDDKYNIALQKVIENYTHYLYVSDGYGDVVYESRNSSGENSAKSPDIKLINVYHKIQANNKGIVYTNSEIIQSRNRTIITLSKHDNLAGLQLADFVAYNINKLVDCKVKQQITDFMKQIHRISYNGGRSLEEIDQRAFWGMRILPSYFQIQELNESNLSLANSNKALANSNHNIKKERNRLKKTIEEKEIQINQLEEEIVCLKEENKKLRCQINLDTSSRK